MQAFARRCGMAFIVLASFIFSASSAFALVVAPSPSTLQPSPTPSTSLYPNSPCLGGGHVATAADIASGVTPGTYICGSDAALISDPGAAKLDLTNNFLTGSAKTRGDATNMIPVFACRLDNFLKAAKAAGHTIMIYSGARPAAVQQAEAIKAATAGHPGTACGNGVTGIENCPHVQGRAADLSFNGVIQISPTQCEANAACKWAQLNARVFDLIFPLTGVPSGNPLERWHIEPKERAAVDKNANCAGGKMPATTQITRGIPTLDGTRDRISSVGYGTPTLGKCYKQPGSMLEEIPCASSNSGGMFGGLFGGNQTVPCFQYRGDKSYTPSRCSISSGGSSGSSGSLFGGGSDFGSMMQMMMGMQLGQGLGGSLFGGSGSNPTPSAPTPAYANPLLPPPIPPIPPQTPAATTRPPGTSAIDQLMAALGNTPAPTTPPPGPPTNTGGSNVLVSSTSVGQLEQPPQNPPPQTSPTNPRPTSTPANPGPPIIAQAPPTPPSGQLQQPTNAAPPLIPLNTMSSSTLAGEISVLTGQLNAATSAIAQASTTGSTSAITSALNSISNALAAIGRFFVNIFTPSATTAP